TMLRIHFMQQWFNLSDPAMEEALYDSFSMRQFAKLPGGRVPDETTILNFRHLLEKNNVAEEMFEGVNLLLQDYGLMVRRGTIVDATIIDAPSSTKNAQGARDPEMHQTKKGNNYFFGMKTHIGVDLHTGLVHSVVARQPTWPMSRRSMACCTGRKNSSWAMQAIRVWASVQNTRGGVCQQCCRFSSRRVTQFFRCCDMFFRRV